MTALSENLDLPALFPRHEFSAWQALVEKELKGLAFEKLHKKTYEDLTIKPIYRAADLPPQLEQTPASGLHRRGERAAGYLLQPWWVCQEIPHPSPETWNASAREDLPQGLDALWLEISPNATRPSLVLEELSDLQTAFRDLPIAQTPLFVRSQAPALANLSLFLGYWEAEGIEPQSLRGGLLEDPLADWAAQGQLSAPLSSILDRSAWGIRELMQTAPQLKSLALDGRVWHRAGASASQELACLIGSAVTYLREMDQRGISPESLVPHLHWTLETGSDFLIELAKIRALRLLWQRVLQAYGLSGQLWLHASSSQLSLSKTDPYVNMLRVTSQAFCAVLGGVNSLSTACFNAPLGLPDSFARRQARNLQLILREESNLARLIDPAGGAYALESLSTELAEKAWGLFQTLEQKGGLMPALATGLPQSWIAETRSQRQQDFAKRKKSLVGTSQYAPLATETELHLLPAPPEPGPRPPRAPAWMPAGFQPETKDFAQALKQSIRRGADIATLSNVLMQTETAQEPAIEALPVYRAAAAFEKLRARVEALPEPPQILLLPFGPLKAWKPRADFAQGFLEVAGLKVILAEAFASAQEAVQAWSQAPVAAAVLCSADADYPEIVPAVFAACVEAGWSQPLLLAGYPKEQVAAHQASGIREFIYLGADLPATLNAILDLLGVPA
ncbi:hypothetical protein COW36_06005 [bacterium (Candidatus Blackallbacteria) CG17_big_fil_post_rev_8_21_14_2_50_48_46]|uniref:Methylmalonyl-CoA mutase alpha/beta chain catalytic domain-containing protein n=1 Tax=bacterium (Candidatus Blackallbacteria) CG17_big_fil_post_rev_8_21_14_2_50_48_46 TaxID=2014261 RepID=A0A2M7G7L9_9BACT|nr:MAG: hypothetical protein COW64_16835 [bacterium (Candidatus Blackallbacteria) CG18_big_fil_WC_8_21_14_2_50_49_26]PIW18082.1 MAG: hypothetical protein COW36_06005 [bacterium (Candidatus Blackallbacteria) CG17_big_fil_post_rev_8_21_14_2_50_48_46]PIW51091.1 MAG: hypothetical protein COW20_00155 [bacterium (Candidatus Blackallbacteria) CG13_big_fil_rev_8_21_14_2_50_49_14]